MINLILIATVAGLPHVQTPQALWRKLEAKVRSAKTVEGSISISFGGNPQVLTFKMMKPGFAVVKLPDMHVYLNGNSGWMYSPVLHQHNRVLTETLEMSKQLPFLIGLEGFLKGPKKPEPKDWRWKTENGKRYAVAELEYPDQSVMKVYETDLWLDSSTGMPYKFEVKREERHQGSGIYTKLRFGASMKASDFKFIPPKDSKLLESPQQEYARFLIQKGGKAPDFSLPSSEGKTVRLSSVTGSAKGTLLVFWSEALPDSVVYLREVQSIYRRLRSQGLIAIAVNTGQSRAKVAQVRRRGPYTFPFLIQAGEKVAKSYGVQVYPSIFLINRKGIVTASFAGADEEGLNEALKGMEFKLR
jgi:peroxiredoxin/outer membrane lipoprotein-sorting protein